MAMQRNVLLDRNTGVNHLNMQVTVAHCAIVVILFGLMTIKSSHRIHRQIANGVNECWKIFIRVLATMKFVLDGNDILFTILFDV